MCPNGDPNHVYRLHLRDILNHYDYCHFDPNHVDRFFRDILYHYYYRHGDPHHFNRLHLHYYGDFLD